MNLLQKNPFIRDYSNTSLLKRNYDSFNQINRLKSQQNRFQSTYNTHFNNKKNNNSNDNQLNITKSMNPFQTKSTNFSYLTNMNNSQYLNNQKQKNQSYKLLNTNIDNHNFSKTFNSSIIYSNNSINTNNNIINEYKMNTLDKYNFYKGLQQIAIKQKSKNQSQQQARKRLKSFGPQALKYQYFQYHSNSNNKINSNNKQNLNSSKYNKNNSSRSISKSHKDYQQYQQNQDSPTFKVSKKYDSPQKITNQYYGYNRQQKNPSKFQQAQLNNKGNKSKDGIKLLKSNSSKNSNSNYNRYSNSTLSILKKKSFQNYFQNIPQDYNQDIITNKLLKQKNQQNFNIQMDDKISVFSQHSLQKLYKTQRQSQIQRKGSFQVQSSLKMYQSGSNFKQAQMLRGKGPLDTFSSNQGIYPVRHSNQTISNNSSSGLVAEGDYPYELEYNNRIYERIL